MANIKLIRGRIKSVKNISQITKAMEMVAASKMKKAQELAQQGKPYADKIYEAVVELASKTDKNIHPLLQEGNKNGKILVILISTNKGLVGGLNTNLFRMVGSEFPKEHIDFISLGKKGEAFVARSGRHLTADFSAEMPFTKYTGSVIKLVVEGFINGTYREVYIVFNTFVNALRQDPTKRLLLPIRQLAERSQTLSKFLIEPDEEDVLNHLLPHYLENQLRSAILEASASEYSAQMIAMKNATDAAIDLISELTLIYNKARQEKITSEIADLVTARLSME